MPKDKLTRVAFNLALHNCRGCRYGVYLALMRVDGVAYVSVTAEPNVAEAWIDETRTARAALEAALTRAGVPLASEP